jgi:hypothetical protein
MFANRISMKDIAISGVVEDLVKHSTEFPFIACPPTKFDVILLPFTILICSIPCLNNPLPTYGSINTLHWS